jgi:CelD/BcsL family acetyltransferase involved in cellulose biosynthesis
MQHVIDIDGVTQVDYLTGDDAYKQDWMSHRRERWGMVAFNPRTLKGAVGILRHMAGRSLRRTASRWLAGTRAPAVTPAPPPRRDRPQ